MKTVLYFNSPIGRIGVAVENERLTHLVFGELPMEKGDVRGAAPLALEAERQLGEYFAGKRTRFDLPLKPAGTAFELLVWAALSDIPYGETRTYKQIAETIGRPKACRAVGRANSLNPISIIVPCHRVIGANGTLTGYAGGLENKRRLLDLERRRLFPARTLFDPDAVAP